MSTTTMANPCDICGDIGVIEAIITCCDCEISRQHLYCMKEVTTDAPPFWLCEECERKKLFSPTENNKELTPESLTQKDSILIKKNTRASKCPIKTAFASRFNFKEKRVNKGRTKYISCEEAVKLSSGAFSPKHVDPPVREKSLTKIYDTTKFEPPVVVQKSTAMKDSIKPNKSFARVETTKTGKYDDMRKDIEVPKSFKKPEKTVTEESTKTVKSEVILPIKEEADINAPKSFQKIEDTNMETGGNNNHADVEAGSYGEQNLTVNEMQDTSIPSFHSYWKGSFYLPNEHEKLNGAFKAHPPSRVHSKVYETLHKMPKNINFDLVPVDQVWVDLFKGDCPYKNDIGLYVFSRFKERYENYSSLIEFLWSKNLVMKSFVDQVELFVFSSRYLQLPSQKFEGSYFLWGVFRPNNVKKEASSSKSMIVHEIYGQKGVIDSQGSTCADFPPGFERIRKPPQS